MQEKHTLIRKRGTVASLSSSDSTCPEDSCSVHRMALPPACFACAWAALSWSGEWARLCDLTLSRTFPPPHLYELLLLNHKTKCLLATDSCLRTQWLLHRTAPPVRNCWTAGDLVRNPLICPINISAASQEEETFGSDLSRNGSPWICVCCAALAIAAAIPMTVKNADTLHSISVLNCIDTVLIGNGTC